MFLEETWAKITRFDSESESFENIPHSTCDDSDSLSIVGQNYKIQNTTFFLQHPLIIRVKIYVW